METRRRSRSGILLREANNSVVIAGNMSKVYLDLKFRFERCYLFVQSKHRVVVGASERIHLTKCGR
jgi:hypothetical protein